MCEKILGWCALKSSRNSRFQERGGFAYLAYLSRGFLHAYPSLLPSFIPPRRSSHRKGSFLGKPFAGAPNSVTPLRHTSSQQCFVI